MLQDQQPLRQAHQINTAVVNQIQQADAGGSLHDPMSQRIPLTDVRKLCDSIKMGERVDADKDLREAELLSIPEKHPSGFTFAIA